MRVLLVDDDPVQLKMVRAWLEPMFFTVDAVDGVIEALQAVAEHDDIKLCIIDWHMTPFSGLAFVAALRTEPRFADLPILMLTGEDDANSVARAIKAGVSGYMLKPLRHRLLCEKMSELNLVVLKDGTPNEAPAWGVPTDMIARPKVRANTTDEETRMGTPAVEVDGSVGRPAIDPDA